MSNQVFPNAGPEQYEEASINLQESVDQHNTGERTSLLPQDKQQSALTEHGKLSIDKSVKSIDLQSNNSDQKYDFDNYIKNREKSKQDVQSQFVTKRQQTFNPSPLPQLEDEPLNSTTNKISSFQKTALEPDMGMSQRTSAQVKVKPIRRGKSQLPPLSKQSTMVKSAGGKAPKVPAVQKPTGVDLPAINEVMEEPKSSFRYISRNTKKFDDDKSDCKDDPPSEDEELDEGAKTGEKYLAKQKLIIEKQLHRTQQMMEVEKQKKALGAKSDQDIKPNKRFKNFNDVFSGLTISKNVPTQYPVTSCIITYNSKSAITVTKKNDREHWIHQFDLETCAVHFEEKFGGIPDESYIKLNEVEQNNRGDYFAACYLDDGHFYLRTFGQYTRTQKEIEENELDINKELGLNNHTMPINNFHDPFIDCQFVNDDLIFVNLFHNASRMHYHFFFNHKTRVLSQLTEIGPEIHGSSQKNFPAKCFYNTEYNEIYTFYRQGQSFRVPVFDVDVKANFVVDDQLKDPYEFQDIFDKDLGQMFLINETALVARSSSQILFFKLVLDEFTGKQSWQNYHTIEEGGNLYFIKGNKRLQIVTDTKIFFYLINMETYEITMENVMNNFMNCSVMMFGAKVKYGVTYKSNEASIDIYRRKYEHDFKVYTVEQDYDGSRGLPVESMNAFLVSKIDTIRFYDIDTFKEIKQCEIKVPLLVSETRERNEIISMQISKCEQFLAVISGKNLIKAEQKPNQIFVFKRIKNLNANADTADKFELLKRIIIAHLDEFEKICMQFCFQNTKYEREPDTLIFARQAKIICINIWTEQVYDLAMFDTPLTRQPDYFLLTDDQSIAIIASTEDGIYFNMSSGAWIDLDETFDIGCIKEIIHDSESKAIYFLANKHKGKMGVFLIKFHEQNPKNFNFFLKYKTKLEIADADIAIMKNKKSGYKELIVSYKTINSNTYNVYIVDISGETPIPLFRHESFQLWESQITAFFIKKTCDYVMINEKGISLVSLNTFDKKYIKTANGQEKMIHSIESINYLKVDSNNFIFFDFAGIKKELNISQQFIKTTKAGPETDYDGIFKIRINDITLRELLLFQSLYVCSTQTDILDLVSSQPNPQVFFKSYLELDGTNMVTILSFDSRSIKKLLDMNHHEYFTPEYPLFYKSKIQKIDNKEKFFFRSAIDMAIQNNQLTAVASIIKYITEYQNNFVSSYLFEKNLIYLMENEVQLEFLLNSQVFCYSFDYDSWPSAHSDREKYVRPYNGSIFQIRDQYRTIFPEPRFEMPDENLAQQEDSSKVYKISYELNILSYCNEYMEFNTDQEEHFDEKGKKLKKKPYNFFNKHTSLMHKCTESPELNIFTSKTVADVIEFKWKQYAINFHMIGCLMHFGYMFLLFVYIEQIYIENMQQNKLTMDLVLCCGLIYPLLYEFYQLKRYGAKAYFSDFNNFNDAAYVFAGIFNLFSQQVSEFNAFHNKVVLTIIITQQIMKSFYYLRIFGSLSYIVTMIFQVVADLRAFLIFFFILVFLFSLVFAVIGAGNERVPGLFQDFYLEVTAPDSDFDDDIPNEEYQYVGLFVGFFMSALRSAIGDFDFSASYYLEKNENIMYWIIWLMIVVITCIIFLNFIIAEASASYENVKENLRQLINKEKASLISEAERMMPDKVKNPILFPKYVIIRKEDN